MSTRTASAASTHNDSKTAASEVIGAAGARLGGKPSFGFFFASPDHDLREVLVTAQRSLGPQVPIIGCTTAGEITEKGLLHGGVTAMLVSSDEMHPQPALSAGLKADALQTASALAAAFTKGRGAAQQRGLTHATTVALVDGLAGTGEQLVDELRRQLGGLHEIVGGAAGDEGRFKRTLVGAGAETREDAGAAMHVFSKKAWSVGVDHGLTAATPLLRVTRAKDNVIFELDGKPAFEVYKSFAQKRGVDLKPDNASSFLINHELGVFVFDTMRKARAPLSVGADGSLACAAAVPQGSSVAILDGKRASLEAAAQSAAVEARDRLGGAKAAGILLFDCICRGTILGEEFGRELSAVRSVFPDVPVAGFLTYGEIARYSGRLDGWHNTTAVVVAIPA